MPERPRQSTAIIPTCKAIITGLIRSIKSLSTTRASVAISAIDAEKTNLLQRICSRLKGRSPRIQKFRPSSESNGKMNRLVNVDKMRAVTDRFRKLTRFRQ